MEYKDEHVCITLSAEKVIFSGRLERSEYTDIVAFLHAGEKQFSFEKIQVELRQLQFLNSTGLKMLAVFLAGSSKTFELLIDTSITWQDQTLMVLQYIKPSGIHILDLADKTE